MLEKKNFRYLKWHNKWTSSKKWAIFTMLSRGSLLIWRQGVSLFPLLIPSDFQLLMANYMSLKAKYGLRIVLSTPQRKLCTTRMSLKIQNPCLLFRTSLKTRGSKLLLRCSSDLSKVAKIVKRLVNGAVICQTLLANRGHHWRNRIFGRAARTRRGDETRLWCTRRCRTGINRNRG